LREEQRGLVLTLSGSVLFSSGKATLLPSAQDRLTQVAEALRESKHQLITIEGHTDSRGSLSFNQVLSAQRAEAVRHFLVSRGIAPERIRAVGMGPDRPVAENRTAEGRANNRRVEIVLSPVPKTPEDPSYGRR
jgi:outer membrane protein OmpA-like peptidoglycan-associated protein